MADIGLDPVRNFATVVVNGLYAAGATTINLQSGEGASLPAPASEGAFNLVWWDATTYSNPEDDPLVEIVRVTARSTDQLTVTRGQEGTSDTAKNTSGKTYKMRLCPTKKFRDDLVTFVPSLDTWTDVTITAGGAITKTTSKHNVISNGGAGVDDDLVTINGDSYQGEHLWVKPKDANTIIWLKGTGNISIGTEDIRLESQKDCALLIFFGSTWRVVLVWHETRLWSASGSIDVLTERRGFVVDANCGLGSLPSSYQFEVHRNASHVCAANIRNYVSGTLNMWGWYADEVQKGAITYNSGGSPDISYDTFSGSHYAQFKTEKNAPQGGVIILLDELARGELSFYEEEVIRQIKNEETNEMEEEINTIKHFVADDDPSIKPGWKKRIIDVSDINRHKQINFISSTTTKKDRRVFGVYRGKVSENSRGWAFGENEKSLHAVVALGEGVIRVTDIGGNIEIGDYLQSSEREWEAEKQTEPQLLNSTIAKARIGVDFLTIPVDPDLGYKWTLIPCTLHCG